MPDVIRMLSLDGGGIRGIIPARVLVEIERLAGRPIASMFDVITGTSTGGLLALGLCKPGDDGAPALTAEEILDGYITLSPTIFPRFKLQPVRTWHDATAARARAARLLGAILIPKRYGNARYSPIGLESVLIRLLGDARLGEAVTDVIIPAYDWKAGRAFLFRSREARDGTAPNPTTSVVRPGDDGGSYVLPARAPSPRRRTRGHSDRRRRGGEQPGFDRV
jgi:predicted acylesterase/phospholipase RssA